MDLFDNLIYNEGFTIRPVLLHPQTHGFVRLRSSNPEDSPIIEPNYLADPSDIKMLVEGINCSLLSFLWSARYFCDTLA